MGFSVAIMAFALADAPVVLTEMGWEETELQVGQPVTPDIALHVLMSEEFQNRNNPHFSAARGADHFLVYASLKELGVYERPDYAALSAIAPLTVHEVVETSSASSIEYWEGGQKIWSVSGASGWGYEVTGPSPVDLDELADLYRDWWASLPHDTEFMEPGELDLPADNANLIAAQFSSLTGNYFADLTGFRYDGEHPPLYRLTGTLPTTDTRN